MAKVSRRFTTEIIAAAFKRDPVLTKSKNDEYRTYAAWSVNNHPVGLEGARQRMLARENMAESLMAELGLSLTDFAHLDCVRDWPCELDN